MKLHSREWRQYMSEKFKGRKLTNEWKKKIGSAQKGEKGNNWKGEKATYNSIHHWIRRTFGKPTQCEFCLDHFEGYFIHWANKSGEYKRDRSDWIRLCAKCHRAFEKTIEVKRLKSHE